MIGIATVMLSSACSQQGEPTTEQAALPRTASPDGASVFFVNPADGSKVANPVSIEFGIAGMSVVRAGDNSSDSGHHHLLVDTNLPDMTLPVPADEKHIHFGDGSTSTELTLAPGKHTLRLLLGDHLHIPHNPPVYTEAIEIIVE
jgi:hypothetical protein